MAQLTAFLLTLLFELPVAIAAGRMLKASLPRIVVAALLASTITHPIVFTLNQTLLLPPWPRLLLLEVGAVVVEAVVYLGVARLRPLHAGLVSMVANGFSFGVGLMLYALDWLPR